MGSAASDPPALDRAGYVAAALTLVASGATAVFSVLVGGRVDHVGVVLFLVAAASVAVTQSVDFGPARQFDGAQPIAVLAGVLGGPIAGATAGAVSAVFYGRQGGSRLTYGSVRVLQCTVAGAIIEVPGLRYDTTWRALQAGVNAEAAAGVVMIAAAVLLALTRVQPFDRGLAASNLLGAMLAAPLVGGLALAQAHAGAGPIVLVLVPALLAIAAAKIFRERWRTRNAESEARANHDPLTGALNRRWFEHAITVEIAGRDGAGLVLLDLDHFKRVNDAHGHAAGDTVLVETVRRLTSGVRPGDAVVRWGGEEFAILLRRLRSGADLATRAEELRASISEQPFVVDGSRISVTASAGAATLSSDADSLIRAADAALYDAKRSGRNRAVLI